MASRSSSLARPWLPQALVVAFALTALAPACSPGVEPEPPPQPTGTGDATARPASTSTATTAATATPAAPPTVVCGNTTCVVGEQICCRGREDEGATCLPAANANRCYEQGPSRTVQACDDSTDCGAGLKCCRTTTESDDARTTCAASCTDYEVCRSAGSCSAEHVCIGDEVPLPGGRCVRKNVAVHCGSTVCEGNQPWCQWDPDDQVGTCIDRARAQASPERVFQCSEDRHCSDQQRCFFLEGRTFCGGTADFAKHTDARFLCEVADDCPRDRSVVYTCEPDTKLPLGLKSCHLGAPP